MTDFTYIVPSTLVGPNKIDLENDIQFNLDELNLSLQWMEPFICHPLDLKIIQKPYLYKNHSQHEVILNESKDYQSGMYFC